MHVLHVHSVEGGPAGGPPGGDGSRVDIHEGQPDAWPLLPAAATGPGGQVGLHAGRGCGAACGA